MDAHSPDDDDASAGDELSDQQQAAGEARQPRSVVEVPIDDIQVGEPLRALSHAHVRRLVERASFENLSFGPVQVDQNLTLLHGRHRLEASKKLEREHVQCEKLDLSVDDTQATRLEAFRVGLEEHMKTEDDVLAFQLDSKIKIFERYRTINGGDKTGFSAFCRGAGIITTRTEVAALEKLSSYPEEIRQVWRKAEMDPKRKSPFGWEAMLVLEGHIERHLEDIVTLLEYFYASGGEGVQGCTCSVANLRAELDRFDEVSPGEEGGQHQTDEEEQQNQTDEEEQQNQTDEEQQQNQTDEEEQQHQQAQAQTRTQARPKRPIGQSEIEEREERITKVTPRKSARVTGKRITGIKLPEALQDVMHKWLHVDRHPAELFWEAAEEPVELKKCLRDNQEEVDLFVLDPPWGILPGKDHDRLSEDQVRGVASVMTEIASGSALALIMIGVTTYQASNWVEALEANGWEELQKGLVLLAMTPEPFVNNAGGAISKTFFLILLYCKRDCDCEKKEKLLKRWDRKVGDRVIYTREPPGDKEKDEDGNVIRTEQKPVNLLGTLISRFSEPGQVVCDLFSGTGTTAVVAMMSGRKFRGCEKYEDAFNAAKARLDGLNV